ncbi:alkaline phosphatase PhoX [Alkalimarinus coralli]|uniref:alkaline phosphatase PhoX n=1 Tax=Alkalimarinus coralli TaxID=2935863 RepID=UPI00202ADB48|nr:alkaline phosphatase PhoX [Alkalimarinus coralli]
MNRRSFLGYLAALSGPMVLPLSITSCRIFGPDKHLLYLPKGFTARVVAVSGEKPVENSSIEWHSLPDGGATFPKHDGWIYVSNSEIKDGEGGVSALSFNHRGQIVDAYSILSNTSRNCNGGVTPWGTWLSCEEVPEGQVLETDPYGKQPPRVLPALGTFRHEAVAFDTDRNVVYLTEDYKDDGRLYRYLPNGLDENNHLNLHDGLLQVARLENNQLVWLDIKDPSAESAETRFQQPTSTQFKGAEGIVYNNHCIYFTTRNSGQVWKYDVRTTDISVIYSALEDQPETLSGIDDITVMPFGQLLVAEDRGNMQIVALDHYGAATPIIKVAGHAGSEITGLAFTPDFKRLYFSSQRGPAGHRHQGVTFEVSGPFTDPTWPISPYEIAIEV